MTQSEINRRMLPWGDAEFRRFFFRTGLFQRRGWTEQKAEFTSDRLALRDQEHDDRRMCIECSHLQRSLTCFVAANGRMPNTARHHQPVQDILQRCEFFSWQKPN